MRTPVVIGNWKMNGTLAEVDALAQGVLAGLAGLAGVEVGVCPSFVHIARVRDQVGPALGVGAQNLAVQPAAGAYTGEVAGFMLKELGCAYVIVGHSERRSLFGETSVRVAEKVAVALDAGLIPVLCVGETLEERESGATEAVVGEQLDAVLDRCGVAVFSRLIVAYEPVWAIGTGRTASPGQAQAVHAFIRGRVAARDAAVAQSLRIQYGGSVKPDNAVELFSQPDIDGGLIGGASLKAADFLAICGAAAQVGGR